MTSRKTQSPKKSRARSKTKTAKRSGGKRLGLGRVARWGFVLFLLLFLPYLAYLDWRVVSKFEGKRWSLPAQVYARPLELYAGKPMKAEHLERELKLLGYRRQKQSRPGSYGRSGGTFWITTRPFHFWDGREPSRKLKVRFDAQGIAALTDTVTGRDPGVARLDPAHVGGMYPREREDRILVRLEETPPALINALIQTEDRAFRDHFGVDPRGVARAVWANLRAGGWVQGGSTLTQQLVKNFWLSGERSLRRKVNEAFMALLLEFHYDKDEILEAYLNEVYLGQAGRRAIHGFGQASWFYFKRPLAELDREHLALLVGLVKGPSYYNPRRNPERAKARRDLVLDQTAAQGRLESVVAARAKRRPLGVTRRPPAGNTPYPAFLDLVRRQLRRDYREEDLTGEGLRVFTTLDPMTQDAAERAVAGRIRYLERRFGLSEGRLQGAVVVTDKTSGEVLAAVGGRDPAYAGFNRVLNAVRPIGSLIKPAVYLTALSRPARYSLITRLEDGPLTHKVRRDGSVWTPKNADGRYHGRVMLFDALAHSYNLATARLGLEIGVEAVLRTLRAMGVERALNPYPSVLLGAAELSPYEVAQMYQTLAGGGFRTPLKTIREVLTAERKPLQRYPLELDQVIDPRAAYLTTVALVGVTREGTARYLKTMLGDEVRVAGKTGTTDDLRDSWFAGFSADRLAVAWLGMDDNTPTKLTAASGAMLVWGDIMRRMGARSLRLETPTQVEWRWVDPATGFFADAGCRDAFEMPFIKGSGPGRVAPCAGQGATRRDGGSRFDEDPFSFVD